MKKGLGAGRLAVALVTLLTLFVAVPNIAAAWDSNRHDRCIDRANRYAADDHPNLTPQEAQERSEWLYEQCAENDAVEAFAEEHGSMAPALFPNTENDRHAHPLHCMSLRDSRFGMHNNHDSTNPPPDPNGPGGAAAANIPGEFMYAFINGKARFMVRYVVWTIDDRDGNPVTPVKINQHPTYQGTPQVTVALLDFSEAYQPESIWVEMPDNMAVANLENGVLPGRRLTMRPWMASKCHDKRDPTVIPQMLIDHMQNLGWLDSGASAQSPRAVRFVSDGNPNEAASWSLTEIPVELPSSGDIFTKNGYKWFYDTGVTYNHGEDTLGPALTIDHDPGDIFSGPAVSLSGGAVDSTDVTSVRLTIQNGAGQFLQNDGSFAANPAELATNLGSPGATSTPWSITVTLPEDDYDLDVMGEDSLGNTSLLSGADFTVGQGADAVAPTASVSHAKGTEFPGPDVTISGVAADNVGVASASLKIKDRDTGLWLQPDGSFAAGVVWHPATIDNPGAAAVTWSVDLTLPTGRYNPVARAFDAAGNEGKQNSFLPFEVTGGGGPDTSAPTTNFDHAKNAVFAGPSVTLTGLSNDNVGVTSVQVKIKNRDTGLWLQADGGFANPVHWHDAELDNPGASDATWSIEFSLPDGRYNPVSRAYDAAGNEGTQTAFRPIAVV